MCSKLERELIDALRASKLPFEIAKGSKHKKVFLAGRMIGVLSKNPGGRDVKLFLTLIRKRVEALTQTPASA